MWAEDTPRNKNKDIWEEDWHQRCLKIIHILAELEIGQRRNKTRRYSVPNLRHIGEYWEFLSNADKRITGEDKSEAERPLGNMANSRKYRTDWEQKKQVYPQEWF